MKLLNIPDSVQWELLVVDNNSTDDTQAVLADFKNRLPLRALFEPRQGKSAACNRVIAEANGAIIVWTDDDVRPHPDWLPAICDAFARYNADFVFGTIKPCWLAHAPYWFGERFHGMFGILDYGRHTFVVSEPRHAFHGANFAARLSVMRQLGGFREDFGPVGAPGGSNEDTELFLRALNNGMTVVYEPRASLQHIIERGRSAKSFHRRRTWKGAETYHRLLLQHGHCAPKILNIPRYIYRLALDDALAYLQAFASRDHSAQFFYELRLIQFAGIVRHALRHARSAPPAQSAVAMTHLTQQS